VAGGLASGLTGVAWALGAVALIADIALGATLLRPPPPPTGIEQAEVDAIGPPIM